MPKQSFRGWPALIATAAAVLMSVQTQAADLNLSPTPLFLSPTVPPLNMLVVGRDHKLYYEAYNDYSDLNGDGVLDLKYKPTTIDYYGYFDSYKCYTHDGNKFNPVRVAGTAKTCGNANEWSGDFLNYLTTARIDALRKVLYGGSRTTDTGSATVLERTYLPQDAHSWGKEYTSTAVDGYDISQYAPLGQPSGGTRHLFANTTLLNDSNKVPRLRVLQNRSERIWNWVSIERPVAGGQVLQTDGSRLNVTPTDYAVRVAVCVTGLLEANCKQYSAGNYKPTGLLQEFGENNAMYFGLLTGSYAKNTSGGVLRRRIDSIANEISATDGTFLGNVDGVITSLNRLKVTAFEGNYQYRCGFTAAARLITEGECQMWGNPIGEMMYEGVRYFAGKASPTAAYNISFGAGEESELAGGGLPVPTWDNPYSNRPVCSKPFETVVSDINPSYDSDQLPGSTFGTFGTDLTGLDVSALGQQIWNNEFGSGTTSTVFIGDVNGTTDGAPTPKSVSSFGNIRGLSPEEPTKQGGYYSASVAYYGLANDINATASGRQSVQTFSVALASPLPKISIPVSNGRSVTLVPFAKSVAGSSISATGTFQPTDQIVDFYVDTLTPTSGRFRVNFEDVEQGADHDMDAITVYEYTVSGDTVTVTLTSEYAFGGITQHMGYVISGTSHDGIYLDVLDRRDGDTANDTDYKLDTPQAFTGTPPAPSSGTGRWNDGAALPFTATRTFTAGSSTGATLLKDPLWYAAKYGGFKDSDANNMPNITTEWDTNNNGTPDNYFLVTNALTLSTQLRQAFEEIIARNTSASSASVNSGSISTDTRIYQARFDTRDWTGQLLAFSVDAQGQINPTRLWDASMQIPAFNSRKIFTVNSDGLTGVPFQWANIDATRKTQLNTTAATAQVYLSYLRGDDSHEQSVEPATANPRYALRNRPSKLGDIVSSSPLYVGAPRGRYSDNLEVGDYSQYILQKRNRQPVVYAGANDGMLHAFNANSGAEMFAFIPGAVFRNLPNLVPQSYSHRYFVDGAPNSNDVYYDDAWHTVLAGGLNLGGQGIYALDITNPTAIGEGTADDTFLWEFTDQNDADLGYTYSQPAIVRLQDGTWAAVFGNGYNNTVADGTASATGNAVLYIVNIKTGALIKKFDTGVGIAQDPAHARDASVPAKPNGLATPVMVDIDGDRVVDVAYAGDLYGNLWKFDLHSTNRAQWDFAFRGSNGPLPFFQATDSSGNAQPITTRPEVARGPYGAGVMVLFGTGKFLESTDKVITPRRDQSFYGLVDQNTYTATDRIASRSQLAQQTITQELTIDPDGTGPQASFPARITSQNPTTGSGWYLDLVSPSGYNGERQVTDPLVRNDRVIFTTLIPSSDPCGFGGSSWLMVLDLLSGGRLTDAQLDTNGDGKVDGNDQPVSGVGSNEVQSRAESLTCISNDCGSDRLLTSGSSSELSDDPLRSVGAARGRQSWRQIR